MKPFHIISVRRSTACGAVKLDGQGIITDSTLLLGRRKVREVASSLHRPLIVSSARLAASFLAIVTVSSCGSRDPVRQDKSNYSQPGRPTELRTPQGDLFFPADWIVMTNGRALDAASMRGPLVVKDPIFATVIPVNVKSANPIYPITSIFLLFDRNQRRSQPFPSGLQPADQDGWAQLGEGCMYFDVQMHEPGYVCVHRVGGGSRGEFRPGGVQTVVTWQDRDAPRGDWRRVRCYTAEVVKWLRTRPDQRGEEPPAYRRGDQC